MILVTFHELSLEAHPACANDSVSLFDGSGDNSTELGKYCAVAPATVTSSSSSVFIVFVTDDVINDGRFSLSWLFVSQTRQGWYCNGSGLYTVKITNVHVSGTCCKETTIFVFIRMLVELEVFAMSFGFSYA